MWHVPEGALADVQVTFNADMSKLTDAMNSQQFKEELSPLRWAHPDALLLATMLTAHC